MRTGLIAAVFVCASCQGLPQSTADPSGRIVVSSAAELQRAINNSLPGSTIVLRKGVSYAGNFTFPAKKGNSEKYITLQTGALESLPEGVRVGPESAPFMAKLLSPNDHAVMTFEAGARNYRVIGIDLSNAPGIYGLDMVLVGDLSATSAVSQPANIEFDRIYAHGDPVKGAKRGFFLNTNASKIRNSYISDFKSHTQDAMAVAVCNGPGPYEITNNYLEGAGYGIIFGGCPNGIPEMAPADVTFSRNYVFKPLHWQEEKWIVKNMFEVKMGRRIKADGNVFENNWVGGQNGFGILYTVRADDKDRQGRLFGVIEDMTFSNNIVINSPNGVGILGQDDPPEAISSTSNVVLRNNLFLKVTNRFCNLIKGPKNVVFENNTSAEQTNSLIFAEGTCPGLRLNDNLFGLGLYGIKGAGNPGTDTLKSNFPGAEVRGNLFIGAGPEYYPKGNWFAEKAAQVGFTDLPGGILSLSPKSPFKGHGSAAKDPGVDWAELTAATAGVVPTRK